MNWKQRTMCFHSAATDMLPHKPEGIMQLSLVVQRSCSAAAIRQRHCSGYRADTPWEDRLAVRTGSLLVHAEIGCQGSDSGFHGTGSTHTVQLSKGPPAVQKIRKTRGPGRYLIPGSEVGAVTGKLKKKERKPHETRRTIDSIVGGVGA